MQYYKTIQKLAFTLHGLLGLLEKGMELLMDKYHLYDHLTNEQKALILTGRLTMDPDMENKVRKLITRNDFNYFDFFKLTIYHRLTSICWKNMQRIAPGITLSHYLNDMLHYMYLCTYEKNQLFLNELSRVVEFLNKESIICVPVKGSYLIPIIYNDIGVRYMSDIDLLFKYSDIDKLKDALNSLGYIQGKYDSQTGDIKPISRSEYIKWKMVSNLFPYVKKCESKLVSFFQLDFRYALDDTLVSDSVNEIINLYIENGFVEPAHYLIHMCTHFYNEGKHTISILDAADMNLIKLCDIREYAIQFMSQSDMDKTVSFAKKHKYEKQLYYTMFFLNAIYCDGYECDIMDRCDILDDAFLHSFGRTTLLDDGIYKKDFWMRIFTCNNRDEITDSTILFKDI